MSIYDQWHIRGLDAAAEDFDEEELAIGDDPAFDVDDLATQYIAARHEREGKDADVYDLAKRAVAEYLQWFDRHEGEESFKDQYKDELYEEECDAKRAYREWRYGYGEGLVDVVASAILDEYAEKMAIEDDDNDDEDEDEDESDGEEATPRRRRRSRAKAKAAEAGSEGAPS